MDNLPAGTLGVSTIDGRVGAFVKFGQRFMGASKADAKWSHVFLIGENDDVYQAMPRGLEKAKLSDYIKDLESGDEVMFIHVPLTDEQREAVVVRANTLIVQHVGYSFATYWYLFLKRLGINRLWLRKRIADSGDLICSQAADYLLTEAGWSTFQDGRSYLDVIPSDFPVLIREDSRYSEITVVEKA